MTKPPEYEKYMKSAQWRNISALMKRQAGNQCAHCGYSSSTLEVHHLNYDRLGRERMSDLVVLCKSCHEAADKKRVGERQAKAEETRYENAYDTYMTKKHGENYALAEPPFGREEFDEWLQRKEELGYDDD